MIQETEIPLLQGSCTVSLVPRCIKKKQQCEKRLLHEGKSFANLKASAGGAGDR